MLNAVLIIGTIAVAGVICFLVLFFRFRRAWKAIRKDRHISAARVRSLSVARKKRDVAPAPGDRGLTGGSCSGPRRAREKADPATVSTRTV